MSLRYALVGLLAEEAMSGYDLTKRFAVSLAHAWPAQHSQIYPELARLMELGWICQTGSGPRGRKVYAATAEGLTALRDWLTHTDADRTLRHEPILRAFFRWTLDPGEAANQFRADAAAYAATLRELDNLARTLDWESSPPDRSARLALEAGLRLYRVLSEWAAWAADRVDAHAATQPAAGERPDVSASRRRTRQ
jgi:DNA-binding PadR family transcriptional regulator